MRNKDDISRRQFFRFLPDRIKEAAQQANKPKGTARASALNMVRPPGALPDYTEFIDACQKCQKCAEACPYDVIDFLGVRAGAGEGTPFINVMVNPCRWCSDFPCIAACESGALSIVKDHAVKPIAKLSLNSEKCLVTSGTICDVCYMQCPPAAKAITTQRLKPSLNHDQCVGCGLCLYHCPAEPTAFSLV